MSLVLEEEEYEGLMSTYRSKRDTEIDKWGVPVKAPERRFVDKVTVTRMGKIVQFEVEDRWRSPLKGEADGKEEADKWQTFQP